MPIVITPVCHYVPLDRLSVHSKQNEPHILFFPNINYQAIGMWIYSQFVLLPYGIENRIF